MRRRSMSDSPPSARVGREREAHTSRDVLARSIDLKLRFPHVLHSPTMRRMEADIARAISGVRGLHVLDLGCGRGEQSLQLLRLGARVTGIDVSIDYVAAALAACGEAGHDASRFEFLVMDAHALAFRDREFDLVIGRGILHHLDLEVALAQVRRVLVAGGLAVFQEPLAGNPLLRLFRRLTPQARTIDERPLSKADLARLATSWQADNRHYGILGAPVAMLTSLILRSNPQNFLLRWADTCEQRLNRIGIFQPLNQYVLLQLRRLP